jgi:hypothetical protein
MSDVVTPLDIEGIDSTEDNTLDTTELGLGNLETQPADVLTTNLSQEVNRMADLSTIRASVIGAHETLHFLKVKGADDENAVYHMVAIRCEASSITTGVQTEDVADVTQKTQGSEITGYQPTIEVSGVFLSSDPVSAKIYELYKKRAVGSELHMKHLAVDVWDGGKAQECDANIEITSFENSAGGNKQIAYTIHLISDPTDGTATIDDTTGVATFTATPSGN